MVIGQGQKLSLKGHHVQEFTGNYLRLCEKWEEKSLITLMYTYFSNV